VLGAQAPSSRAILSASTIAYATPATVATPPQASARTVLKVRTAEVACDSPTAHGGLSQTPTPPVHVSRVPSAEPRSPQHPLPPYLNTSRRGACDCHGNDGTRAHTHARTHTHTHTLLPFIVGTYKESAGPNNDDAACATCPAYSVNSEHVYCTGGAAAPLECTAGERGCVCTRVCEATCVAASGGHACVWEVGRW
jgi:hypothetical protein